MYRKMLQQSFYIVAILLVSVYACKKDNQSSLPVNNVDYNHYSFLALGDSYTIGQSVAEDERFPAQAQALLKATGKQVDKLTYIAATGWTTTDLQNAIDEQKPTPPFNIVTLLIGVNDQSQFHDTSGYSERFTRLVENAIVLTGNKSNRVFVLSIPDYSVTPLGSVDDTMMIRKRIDLFNSINHRIVVTYSVNYTDITTVSKEALHEPSLIASDSLHFSGKMYRKWAELLVPEIREVLK